MIQPQHDTFEAKTGFATIRRHLCDLTTLAPARERALDMHFSSVYDNVARELALVDSMRRFLADSALPILPLDDLERTLATLRTPGSTITTDDLALLRLFLRVNADVRRALLPDSGDAPAYPPLAHIAERLDTFAAETTSIDRIALPDGTIRDNASPELLAIRRRLHDMLGTVSSLVRGVLRELVAADVVPSDTLPTVRDGRQVIPVPAANKRRARGIIIDTSDSGQTVYVEPIAVIRHNIEIRQLMDDERAEIARILRALADELRPSVPLFLACYDDLGLLDFLHAKARLAREMDAEMPALAPGPELDWYGTRHPILERALREKQKEIVTLNITLTPEARLMVISGPNAGGKSVVLKTVGLLQYMLQCGMLVPAHANSHFGIFDDIFLDIGDDQSLLDDLSTYSSHLRSMRRLLQSGRSTSLLLIDEFGSGTEPQIGGALAQALLEEFNAKGMWGVITTHYHPLKQLASNTPGLVNASMLYDRHRMEPTFRLAIGSPGSSFALEIARKTGLPASILDRAAELVGSDYVNMDRYLLDITRDRKYWTAKRQEIHRLEKEQADALERYRAEADELHRERRHILDDARRQATELIDRSNRAIERTIQQIREQQADRLATTEARQALQREKAQLAAADDPGHALLKRAPKPRKQKTRAPSPPPPQALAVGDAVKYHGQTAAGTILSIEGTRATVAFGALKMRVPLAQLQHTDATPGSRSQQKAAGLSRQTTDAARQRQLSFRSELDVRGMRVDEALTAVTHWLDDAISFSASRIRILHGTGTGALRQALRQYLAATPGVAHFHDEDVRLGGAGITVIELD